MNPSDDFVMEEKALKLLASLHERPFQVLCKLKKLT